MRIVQVCPYSWTSRGGVQTHVRHLSRQLRARGHDVMVVAAGALRNPVSGSGRANQADDAEIGSSGLRLVGDSIAVPFNGSLAPICLDPLSGRRIRHALDEFQPDIVHVHEPFIPSVSVSAIWHARAPVVATFHAYCPPSLEASLYSLTTRCLSSVQDRIALRLSVSRAAASYAGARVPGAMQIVPNGVNIDKFAGAKRTPPSGRSLLFVGRLERRKGFDVALRAFAAVRERYSDARLTIVGTGPCVGELDRIAMDIRRSIVMLGDVEDSRLPSLYAAADVFIAPATGGESFGTVLLEAMAAASPIVASDIDGYREVVRADIDALLVPPGDARQLARAISRIFDEPDLAGRLSDSARERAQQFSWTTVTDAVELAYWRLLPGAAEAPVRSAAGRWPLAADTQSVATAAATSVRDEPALQR